MKLFKEPYITQENLQAREEYLQSCLSMFPKAFQQSASGPLDPRIIAPIVWLQNARLSLQRHNLTPLSPRNLRQYAIDQSVLVAQETAKILSRCLNSKLSPSWIRADRSVSLASSASTWLCMHIWRCILLLLFRADYFRAIDLVQAASEIGGARQVNEYCGRYIEFFLSALYNRLRDGQSTNLDEDEEMIAYASGDLQNNPDVSWVWNGGNGSGDGSRSSQQSRSNTSFDPIGQRVVKRLKSPPSTDNESIGWDEWHHIERRVRFLLEQQQGRRQQGQRSPTQPPTKSSPGDASRMTIASII